MTFMCGAPFATGTQSPEVIAILPPKKAAIKAASRDNKLLRFKEAIR